ncbi:MAG TPA: putative baseplate assembly protein [Solirubrobacteraceae bacterium]|jgi:predicted phage baseplate assembly protein|nr:putative baseplate assembly protein [Solirubrobacteraceae bacterium]
MSLPEITLDDRGFQDLVSEARTRIALACPEWTEHNVSDPGITLIELFAWMTDTLLYRVNRIPDKLHVALLELLGVQLAPPAAAATEVRFMLAGPVEETVEIPAVETEVGTVRTTDEPAIVFQVTEGLAIEPQRPAAYAVQRAGAVKDVGVARGRAKPTGADRAPFASPPQVGDALLLGFAHPIGRLVMQVEFDGSHARGAGVDPEDPPLRWEVSGADGSWSEATVLEDLTGGFNFGAGTITLELPRHSAIHAIAGHRMHWLRCRLHDRTRSGAVGVTYSHAPEVYEITAAPVGAVLPAAHAASERHESLGVADGTPGAVLRLRNRPVLSPAAGETLEVREPGAETWRAWEMRESFAASGPHDRHAVLDAANGEVALGPAVRQPNGGWRQYGAIPPNGAALRFSRYRHGGGRAGNVAADTLTVLKTAIPSVASVTNPRPALGGVDAESLASARERAALEIRSRDRAVTAEDFELLAVHASPQAARAICVPPSGEGPICVHVLPRVDPADRRLTLEELTPGEELLSEIAAYLDERRLIGTAVHLLPVRFKAVSVVVNLQVSPLADPERVEQDVEHALYTYLNPLIGGSPHGPGEGWPFGRALNQGELFGVVHAIEGVEFVKILRLYETDLATGEQAAKPLGGHLPLEDDELIASGSHVVKATHREL